MTEFSLPSDVAEIALNLGEAAQDFSGKTILLTGGRGFLGRYFTEVFAYLNEHVLKEPCKLVSMDNLITAGKAGNVIPDLPNVEFIEHDVIQPFEWDRPLDYVIHAAGIASPYYYRAYPIETLMVSVNGTRNMLELANKHQARFVFFSSSEIYGDPDPKHVPTPESYRGNVASQGPRACYDESKRVGETLCHIYHDKFGTSANVIRPFNVYGPGMMEADYRVLPNFASRIKGGKPLHVYGSGNQTRTFCYISDAMTGFMLTVLKGVPGETYNIGNPKPEISMVDLVKHIENALDQKVDYDIIEYPDSYPADEPNRRCPDIRKANVQIEFEPSVGIEDGLKRFLTWADGIYIGEQ
ncbi:MAG: NAD-dependent epimerase/dehydratase family protein [Rhodospirillaceae bacterium]|jgi:UDP-glucuronate decarboxylase|nr:NAD-dependent epimerase/dehydratase family protein [Rhodospirillales bacterium]MBT3907602.1 NAD-dependent epimerase/dehydratase family protein [Rhodospirillaceae bacterium]MBT4703159.1 NAD-dependent epimerase/dehydratase family protein [Rhodospirillaceae bacterium]MBT5033107.1 NAD-dependent epimerase/dehydratase family protein [Rhodospirillaceae bacterium]MBT6219915.1 NAD-dependent epimerase/dehydratase family protein [Rhodospirillaceae bacterium]